MPDDPENLIIQKRLEDLESVAAKLSIQIERCSLTDNEFAIESGHCRVNGQDMILLDKTLPARQHMEIILNILGQFDLETIYVPSWIRDYLENLESGASSQ